ncbi:hypothetical protein HAX54_033886 [Datura stramonium]|uniref:Uncharacterized protein n=1 Tax=Datura stramonium TaxID=4076 RepID=A0ABS8VE92_DATST|nr:hypothetical protein [Datura stramonium]
MVRILSFLEGISQGSRAQPAATAPHLEILPVPVIAQPIVTRIVMSLEEKKMLGRFIKLGPPRVLKGYVMSPMEAAIRGPTTKDLLISHFQEKGASSVASLGTLLGTVPGSGRENNRVSWFRPSGLHCHQPEVVHKVVGWFPGC